LSQQPSTRASGNCPSRLSASSVAHVHYEGANAAFASPVSAEGVKDFAEYGGEFQAWAPDGSSFCTQSSTFSPGGTWLVDAATLEADNLEGQFPDARVDGCWLNQRGEVALMTRPASGPERVEVVVIAKEETPTSATFEPREFWYIRGWLPDGSGLLAHRSVLCFLCNDDEPLIAILELDGSMHRFVFDVASQRTLGAETRNVILGIVAE